MNKTRLYALSILAFLTLLACVSRPPKLEIQEQITYQAPDLFAEGIAYDARENTLYVSSMKYGTVGTVAVDGSYSEVISAERLVSVSGINIDPYRRRLFVANIDVGVSVKTKPETQQKIAGLAIYDLDSKKLIKYVSFAGLYPAKHFINDITIAADGSSYITDSFSGVIYTLDPDLENPQLLINNELFKSGDGFRLNGIALDDSQQFLYVNKSNSGELFRVSIAAKTVSKLALPAKINISGADALVYYKDYLLTLHNSGNDGMSLLKLDEQGDKIIAARTISPAEFASLTKVRALDFAGASFSVANSGIALDFPTSIAQDANSFYILNASLGKLFAGESASEYSIFNATLMLK